MSEHMNRILDTFIKIILCNIPAYNSSSILLLPMMAVICYVRPSRCILIEFPNGECLLKIGPLQSESQMSATEVVLSAT